MIRRASILILVIAMCTAFVQKEDNDTIYYVSLNRAIHAGQFDGIVSVNKLKRFGNIGLGSEERLAGEMVLLDGEFYSIPSHGKATKMKDEDRIAFASVKQFKADTSVHIQDKLDIKNVQAYLDSHIDQNAFAVLRIDGTFRSIEFRNYIEQEKPYKPIDEVKDVKYRYENIEGTIIGFFTPKSAEVLNSPNYHFHFIDKRKQTGGHVIECNVSSARAEIDYAQELHVILPQKQKVQHIDLNRPIQQKLGNWK